MRKSVFIKLAAIPALLALTSCVGEVPFVGVDASGKEIETLVPSNQYVKQIAYSVGDMSQSAIPAADSNEARSLAGFRELELGLAIDGSASIGVISITGTIGYELIFAN